MSLIEYHLHPEIPAPNSNRFCITQDPFGDKSFHPDTHSLLSHHNFWIRIRFHRIINLLVSTTDFIWIYPLQPGVMYWTEIQICMMPMHSPRIHFHNDKSSRYPSDAKQIIPEHSNWFFYDSLNRWFPEENQPNHFPIASYRAFCNPSYIGGFPSRSIEPVGRFTPRLKTNDDDSAFISL